MPLSINTLWGPVFERRCKEIPRLSTLGIEKNKQASSQTSINLPGGTEMIKQNLSFILKSTVG